MNFATKKAYFPTNRVIKEHFCFPRMCTSQNFDFLLPNLFRSFSLALFFFFSFLLHQQFFFCLEFAWNCGLPTFRKGTNLVFTRQQVSSKIGSGFFLKLLPFFVNVTLFGLVRKFKTRYRWKYFLTLSLTDLFSRSEFIISSRAWPQPDAKCDAP